MTTTRMLSLLLMTWFPCAALLVSCDKGGSGPGLSGPVAASFSVSPTSGTAPLTVTFTNTSNTAGVFGYSHRWVFGDGGSYVGDTPPPHTYMNAGTYCPTLQVFDLATPIVTVACPTDIVVTPPAPLTAPPVHTWVYQEGAEAAAHDKSVAYARLDDVRTDPDGWVAIVIDANGDRSEIPIAFWSELRDRELGETWVNRDRNEQCRLAAIETIQVPAGVFDCRVVERLFGNGRRTLTWYHPEAWRVREVRFDDGRSPIVSELVHVTWWPPPVVPSLLPR